MQLKSVAAAAALLIAAGAASAMQTAPFDSHEVEYDDTTTFGMITSSYNAGGGATGFSWIVDDSVQVASFGDMEIATFDLPSFTITAKSGWTLSNPSAFFGNLVFTEVMGATTQIKIYADVSVNGVPAVSVIDDVDWTPTAIGTGFLNGYYGETFGPVAGGFTTLSVSNAYIVLSATGGLFSSISSQPQNRLEVSLVAMPVPEPETYAMMLAGLGALGWMARRRRTQG
jgi:hypothetical protein